MKAIHKIQLEIIDKQTIMLPSGSEILCVQAQNDIPCIWYINHYVNNNTNTEPRIFRIITTGEQRNGIPTKYIGTFQLYNGKFIGHLFELNK